jgi:nucleoside-diphosphate-sugar epimerase
MEISGTFNIASGNYTLGELADYVSEALRDFLGLQPKLDIKHLTDVRNYKVSYEKAQTRLGYKPAHDVRSIVKDLVDHRHLFSDFNDPRFSNIATFKRQDGIPQVAVPKLLAV